jgi:hypothetical protein
MLLHQHYSLKVVLLYHSTVQVRLNKDLSQPTPLPLTPEKKRD